MYIVPKITFLSNSSGESNIDINGVNIIVKKPLNTSEIIRAIFFLSIVHCNLKDGVWQSFTLCWQYM